MDDERAKAIKDLEDIINIYERHKKQGSITRALVLDTEIVESLKFALESIKVDRVYELMYEKVDFIEIPEGATNGEMIKAMFPNVEIYTDVINEIVDVEICEDRSELRCSVDWWDSPYKRGNEND